MPTNTCFMATGFCRAIIRARQPALVLPAIGHGSISRRWLLVLDSSQFQDILDTAGQTCIEYAGDPLSAISEARRGILLETLARKMLERQYPERHSEDALSSLACVDGRRRNSHFAEWDFTHQGRRVELKTAKLCFDSRARTWRVGFFNVKFARAGYRAQQPFDDLYLLIYTPNAFYLIKHDLQTGVCAQGIRTSTEGHAIWLSGRSHETSWRNSLTTILDKLLSPGHCEFVQCSSKQDPLVTSLYDNLLRQRTHPQAQAYERVPLHAVSPVLRAQRVEKIALSIDRMMNPASMFASAAGEFVRGHRRGNGNAAVDWIRDEVRVEVKCAQVRFDENKQRWHCEFRNIKDESTKIDSSMYFDELWLAIYSPFGLDFFKHPYYRSSLSSRGVCTASMGKVLRVVGACHELCVKLSVERMKAKLAAARAELFCTVRWTK